jgi:hypothetical protein
MGTFRSFRLVALLVCLPLAAQAQNPQPGLPGFPAAPAVRSVPSAPAMRLSTAPRVDGQLDDLEWMQVRVIDAFTQRDPVDGAPASELTEVRIAYDDEAIYIAARMSDSGAVTSRLGRRDMPLASSDWFRVSFDSFYDKRAGFRFDVNPAGVRRDSTLTTAGMSFSAGPLGGTDGDLAWDAVWDASTSVDAGGWTAELRIPFSQLRFSTADEQVWGLQLERIIDRKQEHVLFSFTPKSEPGGVAAFGDLHGLRDIRPGRPLELIPYVLSNADFASARGNPLRGTQDFGASGGLDARYRLTSSLILSATANPDFGQVEVDPAIINLTAFEVRLEEKRPFFVEGAGNFRFGGNINGPGGNAAALLYSRRVGRPPQLGLSGAQVDAPGVTRILGAAKLTGKTTSGWSIGALNAVTGNERGRFIDAAGLAQRGLVEPRTNYFTGRLNREFRRGMTTIGGIVTSVNRQTGDASAARALRSAAYTGGIDFSHDWANRSWGLGGYLVGSQVQGTPEAMLLTQRSSGRYYQRPDSRTLRVDPTATSMGGYAGTIQIRKVSGEHWTGDAWVGATSPGFEINDAGFLQRSDRLATGGALRYSERNPGRLFRNWSLYVIQNHTKNYDGDWIEKVIRPNAQFTFLNYWSLALSGSHERERMDDRLTRGGPLALKPSSWSLNTSLDSDPRRTIGVSFDVRTGGDRAGSRTREVATLLEVRTSPRWNLSFGPSLMRVRQDAQYVTSVSDALATDTYGARYIFAPLEQTEMSLVTRLNYTFTPDLTLEMYLQPLVSNGDYGTPKQFQTPSGYAFAEYGTDIGTIARDGSRYTIDPDGDGPARAFNVGDRSFTTRSLRGNVVLRWEYRAGSTMYLVWQQQRLNPAQMNDFGVGRALGGIFDGDSENVFVLKWSYRFNP